MLATCALKTAKDVWKTSRLSRFCHVFLTFCYVFVTFLVPPALYVPSDPRSMHCSMTAQSSARPMDTSSGLRRASKEEQKKTLTAVKAAPQLTALQITIITTTINTLNILHTSIAQFNLKKKLGRGGVALHCVLCPYTRISNSTKALRFIHFS